MVQLQLFDKCDLVEISEYLHDWNAAARSRALNKKAPATRENDGDEGRICTGEGDADNERSACA
jgi:hypothetical protein